MFTKRQLEQIHQGKCEGVNVEVYLDPEINEIDMWLVRKTLEQLQAKYEEFNKVFIKSDYKVLKSHPIELSMYDSGLTPGMVAYIAKHANPDIHYTLDVTLEKNYQQYVMLTSDCTRFIQIYSGSTSTRISYLEKIIMNILKQQLLTKLN